MNVNGKGILLLTTDRIFWYHRQSQARSPTSRGISGAILTYLGITARPGGSIVSTHDSSKKAKDSTYLAFGGEEKRKRGKEERKGEKLDVTSVRSKVCALLLPPMFLVGLVYGYFLKFSRPRANYCTYPQT